MDEERDAPDGIDPAEPAEAVLAQVDLGAGVPEDAVLRE